MNFKAWNMKKGLTRIWIIGSVFWFAYSSNRWGILENETLLGASIIGVVSVVVWWALLYLGFWIARGFVDDDDKKAGF